MAKALPARSSRGNRIHKLIGEEAEADDAFWNQDAWNEDAEDSDYESEEEEEDVVDSDFDQDEQPDEDVHDDDNDDDEKHRRPPTATRRSAYAEPQRRPAKRPRRTSGSGDAINTVTTTTVTSQPQQIAYEAPQLRQSTARKSSHSEELRRKILEEAARLSAKAKKPPVVRTRLTQEELLIEAVRTEVENTQSLNRLERLEEEKKAENAIAPKAPFTGVIVRYHSRIGTPKTITFVNADQFPSIFNQPPAKKRERIVQMEEPVEEDDDDDDEEDEEDDDDVDDAEDGSTHGGADDANAHN